MDQGWRPVHGINARFGNLARVCIDADDLEMLQRNLVPSHAAGVGEPMPIRRPRPMMMLKLAGLARSASDVRSSVRAAGRAELKEERV